MRFLCVKQRKAQYRYRNGQNCCFHAVHDTRFPGAKTIANTVHSSGLNPGKVEKGGTILSTGLPRAKPTQAYDSNEVNRIIAALNYPLPQAMVAWHLGLGFAKGEFEGIMWEDHR